MDILNTAKKLGADRAVLIKAKEIILEPAVKDACTENTCSHYNKNFMCPPYVEDITYYNELIGNYQQGILVQITRGIKGLEDKETINKYASQLHRLILQLEKEAGNNGYPLAKAFSAGHCKLCNPCEVVNGADRCAKPQLARPSMEATGINVIDTCSKVGMPIEFLENEVTWVGLILLK